MKRLIFPLILFFLLVTEGIAIELLPNSLTSTDILIVPHWILMFLILIALHYDRNDTFHSIVYSVCFGLLIDVVYTDILGVYMFVYPVAVYIVLLLKRFFLVNLPMSMIITIIGITIAELLILLIFSIIGMVDIPKTQFFVHRLLPTLLANLLFFIPIYLLSTKTLIRWGTEQLEK